MDVTTGSCLQTGVTGATGGLTLQPQCNVPSDSKVHLLPLSPTIRIVQRPSPFKTATHMTASYGAEPMAPLLTSFATDNRYLYTDGAVTCRSGN